MAFLEQGFKTGQFLRLDGSHFDARTGLHHTTRRCSLFRWRFHPSPSHRKTRKLSRTKSNPSTSASYKTRRRNPESWSETIEISFELVAAICYSTFLRRSLHTSRRRSPKLQKS